MRDEELYRAIIGHHDNKGVIRESLMEKSIYAVDPITGFITAIAKGYPGISFDEFAEISLNAMKNIAHILEEVEEK